LDKITWKIDFEIPGNSRREFEDARFPGIPGNSRTGIPGGPGQRLLYRLWSGLGLVLVLVLRFYAYSDGGVYS